MLFRMPIVPGITDEPSNLEKIADFLQQITGTTGSVELMPYHRLAEGKYRSLDRPYPLTGLAPLTAEDLAGAQKVFVDYGLECTISN